MEIRNHNQDSPDITQRRPMVSDDSTGATSDQRGISPSNPSERGIRGGRDFSAYNRELTQQIDPDTQERIVLLTKKQFIALQIKALKDF